MIFLFVALLLPPKSFTTRTVEGNTGGIFRTAVNRFFVLDEHLRLFFYVILVVTMVHGIATAVDTYAYTLLRDIFRGERSMSAPVSGGENTEILWLRLRHVHAR
jgi:hypothetical protein